jgi:anti-sigma factor RsiW
MKSCEEYEIELSSLVDGELPPQAAGEALEHAFGCAGCRGFYLAARRLEKAGSGLRRNAIDAEAGGEAGWQGVQQRLAERPGVLRWLPSRALRAAALVALGLGGGYLLSGVLRPLPGTATGATTASAPAGSGVVSAATSTAAPAPTGAMDEHRFVALADELMRADVRYQRAMLQVLRLVPALETGEGLQEDGGPTGGFVRATTHPESVRQGAL